MDKLETLPPPPGVIGSLKAGFDAIASNIAVILMPLFLDLLLWLGPRLRVDQLFKSFFLELTRYFAFSGLPSSNLKAYQESTALFLEQLQQYNLLAVLRTFPIGVFSLMSGTLPSQTPFGSPFSFQITSPIIFLGWVALLTLVGWIIGGFFFRWVSLTVIDPSQSKERRFGHSIVQTMLLSVLYITLAMMLGTPAIFVFALIVAASPVMAQVILLVLGVLSMWLLVPIFFTPHGIFLHRQNAFSSIYTSVRMARFTLPTSSLFVLSVFLIAYGLNYLWNIPSSGSWMALVGIAGHAFVTTSLLAASFIYYRDMQVWLQTVFEKLKANLPTQQA